MPRLTANMQAAEARHIMEDGVAKAHIQSATPKTGKPPSKAVYLDLTWKIDDYPGHPEYTGREIRFDQVMYGGISAAGNPINTDRFGRLVEYSGTPWECCECHNGMESREFLMGTGDTGNGKPKGKRFCPDCQAHMNIDFDNDVMLGRVCMIAIGHEGDEPKVFNTVKDYGPIVP